MPAQLGLAYLAGLLSVLSPCVLPLLPLVFGAAAAEHRFGPLALAGGLILSFVTIGLFVATIGFAIGFDDDAVRIVAAVLMVVTGLVLMVPGAQSRFALVAAPVGHWAEGRFGGVSRSGLGGQAAVGLLLGAVWSPCVGPTLGAASLLASESRDLGRVALTMMVFAAGAAGPLLLFGTLSRELLKRWRTRMMRAGHAAKVGLGAILVLTGALTASGADRRLESALVDWSPAWLTTITTRY